MKTQMLNNYVEHRYGGNGFVVLGDHSNPDYCRVGRIADVVDVKTTQKTWVIAKNQAFLASKDLLSAERAVDLDQNKINRAIPEDAMPTVNAIRAGLESGDLVVVQTRIVAA